MMTERSLTLAVTDGTVLDARMAIPSRVRGGLVCCHPHPLYGGDMDNPVVLRVAEVTTDAGLATVRFNFRGVGRSTGEHDQGRGEQQDVLAALAELRTALPSPLPLILAGYSFGAGVVAAVAGTAPSIAGLALVAPAVSVTGLAPFSALGRWPGRLLVIAGSADEYGTPSDLDRLRAALPSATVSVIEGANHFFFGRLFPLGEGVRTWLDELVQALGQPGGRGGPR